MFAFIIRRLLQSVLVMLTVALIAFGLFRFVGDPINNLVGQETTLQDREKLRETLGLNDPFVVQYWNYVVNTSKGNFGFSYMHRRPVKDMLLERMPATLELSLISVILALFIGVPMGVYTGLHRNGILAKAFMSLSLIGISLPTFL
ncbi:MAG TPA: ABC transporter permease, partial [Alphaproteobacteria bacterium]|nr:ABC transporter permease [Alphaproteobacteria bacterium]